MKKIFLLTGICAALSTSAQQDAQYNLYQFNQMIINPAYAGARDGLSAILATRQQWSGFSGAPQTHCLSIHGPILKKNLGVGLTVVNDIMGPRNVIGAYGNVAYLLKLSNTARLSFGLNAGYNKYQFNFSKIKFQNGEVPSELTQNINPGTLDINGGLFLKMQSFFVGLSATHINTPSVYTFEANVANGKYTYKLSTHMFLTMGKSFVINENLIFAPTILVKFVNPQMTGDVNLNLFIHKKLWLGAFYRYGYGPGALIQYYITNNFRAAYSYDTGLNDARRLGPSHEVMIGFDFSSSSRSKIVNPRFL
jgi:type IX secretion system PorP/SprF family membrane protein